MSKPFARKFYNSPAWKKCRESYVKKEPLCEICLKKGIYTPVEIVHHIIELTPDNINDPNISLSHDNLESVCRECHLAEHSEQGKRRYFINEDGDINIKHPPSPLPPLPPSPPHI